MVRQLSSISVINFVTAASSWGSITGRWMVVMVLMTTWLLSAALGMSSYIKALIPLWRQASVLSASGTLDLLQAVAGSLGLLVVIFIYCLVTDCFRYLSSLLVSSSTTRQLT